MAFCTNCGKAVGADHKFCRECGRPTHVTRHDGAEPMHAGRHAKNEGMTSGGFIRDEPEHDNSALDNVMPEHDAKGAENDAEDRRTLFEEGVLVLTPENLILYSSRTKDELTRIPISIIADCSYSRLRRCLLIKKMINMEGNLTTYANKLKDKQEKLKRSLADLKDRLDELKELRSLAASEGRNGTRQAGRLRHIKPRGDLGYTVASKLGSKLTGTAKSELQARQDEVQKIKSKMRSAQRKIDLLEKESAALDTDQEARNRTMRKVADIKKEWFTLPKNHLGQHAPKNEYKIWEYVVQRRIKGVLMLRAVTEPYDAIIQINHKPVGTTPATIELPLMDDAILDGKYQIEILKEGCEMARFVIPARLAANDQDSSRYQELAKSVLYAGKRLHSKHLKLKPTCDEHAFDAMVKSLREKTPDRSINLADHAVELEAKCLNEVLIFTRDKIFVMSRDKQKCLYEIPYGAIIKAGCGSRVYSNHTRRFVPKSITKTRLGKMIGWKSRSIRIKYDEPHYKNLSLDYELDNQDGLMSEAEVLLHMDKIKAILDRKMAGPGPVFTRQPEI